jgi:phosphoglucomutase
MKNLTFGTGGLRAVMGDGDDRMNLSVVRRATQGLADYVKENSGTSVCIAYDTRNMSREFAEAAAKVLCANSITTYMFTDVRPTPMLSFAVREKKAFAGIVITASHNPREYNGYKVYGADGGQITDEAANAISAYINKYGFDCIVPQASLSAVIALDDVDSLYYDKVKSLITRADIIKRTPELSILYTPLHGSGNLPVRRVLGELGFTDLSVVAEQELPDGDFPTVPYPNPEEPESFTLALEQAQEQDIILATDPDCDRIGVQARTSSGGFAPLSGNQIGALLCEYMIAANTKKNPAIIKTIVTTELARRICEANNVALVETLTGFKYIGEKIGEWERTDGHSFLFGFEESYGYLAGDFVRDKDAVIAAALICEMTLFYKLSGRTLHDALESVYQRYGYADERLVSIALDDMEKTNIIMKRFRAYSGEDVAAVEDYLEGIRGLPKSDVVKVIFKDGSWLAVRPSGTEPKIKFYFGAAGNSRDEVKQRLHELASIEVNT